MKNKFIYISLFALLLFSCDNYLDVEPKGKVIPSKIVDFDELLVGGYWNIFVTSSREAMWLSSDDAAATGRTADFGDISSPTNQMAKFFRWDKDRYPVDASVQLWDLPYNNLYTLNFVIENVDGAEGNDAAKARIKAEARTMRAYEYYMLVNSFAKQYDAASASTDPGVPLVLSADVEAETPNRSSVQEIYDFIISELEAAVTDLPEVAIGITRPAKEAAYGILARVYLQMGDYENARLNANLALELNNSLSDYTSDASIGALVNAERYMARYYKFAVSGYYAIGMSEDAQALFDLVNDVRANGIWQYSNFRQALQLHWSSYNSHCVSVPEMYVIRAECNARLTDGTIGDVLTDLNILRRNRIRGYVDSTGVASKEAALVFAIEERRREMMATGLRLFDLKRLNKEPAFAKTMTHVLDGETFTLAPNSNRYVFPIPDKVIKFNPEMEQNPKDD